MQVGVAEGSNVAVPLQLLLVQIHGQRDVNGDHQLQVDPGLGARLARPGRPNQQERRNQARHPGRNGLDDW